MSEKLIPCDQCGKINNWNKVQNCWCSECEKNFCSTFSSSCFLNHKIEHSCKGSFREILSPEWLMNLRTLKYG